MGNERREKTPDAQGMSKREIGGMAKGRVAMDIKGMSPKEINDRLRAIGESQGIPGGDITEEKIKRFDETMRKRFGVKWAPPVPVSAEDMDPGAVKQAAEGVGAGAEALEKGQKNRGSSAAARAPEAGAGAGKETGTGAGKETGKAGVGTAGKAGKGIGTGKAGKGTGTGKAGMGEIVKTNPNRAENELMLNLMILRNALHQFGPAARERARRAGGTTWRDLRLMTVLVEKVQERLIKTMPARREEYYMTYARHGHYELAMNGPIRNKRMVLISDKYLAALCEAAMDGECTQCFREGRQIGQCMLRQAMLEVAPPRELQDGRWLKCEYRDAAGSLICGEDITI